MDYINALLTAIQGNEDYNFSDDNMNFSVKHTDNGIEIVVNKHTSEIDNLRNNFTDYLNQFSEEDFEAICLKIDNLDRVNECFNSNDIESVRSAIHTFKVAIKQHFNEKIAEFEFAISELKSAINTLN